MKKLLLILLLVLSPSITLADGFYTLHWDAVPEAEFYAVYRQNEQGNMRFMKQVDASTLSLQVWCTDGKEHCFGVTAIKYDPGFNESSMGIGCGKVGVDPGFVGPNVWIE